MENGNSFSRVFFSMDSGVKSAHAPQTTMRLKMLEPATLLTARVLFPIMDAVTLTASSGRLVPIATIVIPMIKDGTLNFWATDELPSTKKSAPLIRRTKPITRIIADFKSSIFLFLSFFSYWGRNSVFGCAGCRTDGEL